MYMHQCSGSSLVQVMTCPLFSTKPLPEQMLIYCWLETTFNKINKKEKGIQKCHLQYISHIFQTSMSQCWWRDADHVMNFDVFEAKLLMNVYLSDFDMLVLTRRLITIWKQWCNNSTNVSHWYENNDEKDWWNFALMTCNGLYWFLL